jgi:quinol monooxygenase YgiN
MHRNNRGSARALALVTSAAVVGSLVQSVALAESGDMQGKVRLAFVIVCPADQVDTAERLFATHAGWMEETHSREGEEALLSYDVSKAPELSNPLDPASDPTGNTVYVLAEIYESQAGIAKHFELANTTWEDFPDFMKLMEDCQTTAVPAAVISNSLW